MILGITGRAGSGKDTIADILAKDYRYVKVGLADPLKRICRDVFGFSYLQLWGPSESRNAPDLRYPRTFRTSAGGEPWVERTSYLTPRHALQQLGTEWGRACYANVWVDMAIRTAQRLESEIHYAYTQERGVVCAPEWGRDLPAGVVIPDARFENEILAIKAAGGKVIRVMRPGAGLDGAAGAHVSEREQDDFRNEDFDAVIYNDGSPGQLAGCIDAMMKGFDDLEGRKDARAFAPPAA